MNTFLFAILVAGCGLVLAAPKDMLPTGKCECAAFKFETPTTEDLLMTKTPSFAVECNEEGKETCKKMCFALAEASKEQAGEILCEALNAHADNLKPAVFSRSCDDADWTFTGMKATIDICCHEGKRTPCQSQNVL